MRGNVKGRRLTAALLALLCLAGCRAETGGEAEARADDAETVVLECGGRKLTNAELGYYFWSEYFYLLDSAADQFPSPLDPTLPLDGQDYDGEQTWYDYILDQTLRTAEDTIAMALEAESGGFALPESFRASLDEVRSHLDRAAAEDGFVDDEGDPDAEAYLIDSFGPGATLASFTAYLEDSYLAAAYSDELYSGPTFTDREISDYYDLCAADYEAEGVPKTDDRLRAIRMVLVTPDGEGEDAWADAEAAAQTLYATWQSESGSEADFAAMADAHSAGQAEGGLYEDLAPADLSGALASWTFDAARERGDTAVLRGDEGWAVVYFAGLSEKTIWQKTAETDLRRQTFQNALREIGARYPSEVSEDKISIFTPTVLRDLR